MRTPQIHRIAAPAAQPAAQELAAGLLATPAQISPKYFYDALGARLFEAITELDEYYPTRTEAAIFERLLQPAAGATDPAAATDPSALAAAVHRRLAPGFTLIDLGAGDGAKAERLFDALRPGRYVAVDISADFLELSLRRMQQRRPALDIVGVGLDFSQALALPPELVDGPALVFYPGSSIGNFPPAPALRLLRQARALAAGGALLIGVDLVKPVAVLERAYDDALGVTAAFNLNVLRHVNRVLGSDFDVADWRHVAGFNAAASRIEMHLEARRSVTVRWSGGGTRRFNAGERLLTEYSYKWRVDDFGALLRDAGFGAVQHWRDERDWFALLLADA